MTATGASCGNSATRAFHQFTRPRVDDKDGTCFSSIPLYIVNLTTQMWHGKKQAVKTCLHPRRTGDETQNTVAPEWMEIHPNCCCTMEWLARSNNAHTHAGQQLRCIPSAASTSGTIRGTCTKGTQWDPIKTLCSGCILCICKMELVACLASGVLWGGQPG